MTAVMQPYLFPYPGYFQLLVAADDFYFYDDVQFIKGGYINRNKLANGNFTVPLAKASARATINERVVSTQRYPAFVKKWGKGFRLAYGNAPYFAEVSGLVERVFVPSPGTASELAAASVRAVAEYLGLSVTLNFSSALNYDRQLAGQEKLLSLLATIGARSYVNSINGSHLYSQQAFAARNIDLCFLQPELDRLPDLAARQNSILHLLAHYPAEHCRQHLSTSYTLHPPTTHHE